MPQTPPAHPLIKELRANKLNKEIITDIQAAFGQVPMGDAITIPPVEGHYLVIDPKNGIIILTAVSAGRLVRYEYAWEVDAPDSPALTSITVVPMSRVSRVVENIQGERHVLNIELDAEQKSVVQEQVPVNRRNAEGEIITVMVDATTVRPPAYILSATNAESRLKLRNFANALRLAYIS